MLSSLMLQHLDAVITTLGGVFCTVVGFRASARGDSSRQTTFLKRLGPFVIAFGLFRFLIPTSAEPNWQRVATSDQIASVEFPSSPQPNDQTLQLHGQTVRTVGWVYALPGRDISLRLSYGDVPESEVSIPVADRFDFTKQSFDSQGFTILSEQITTDAGLPVFHLHLQTGDAKAQMWARLAYRGTRVYRAVATSAAALASDPVIQYFLDSFQVTAEPSANKSAP